MGKLHSGIILQVTKPGLLAHKMMNEEARKTAIEVGDIIEITIAFEWHFRTLDGEYFHAPEDEILEHCTIFAATPPSLHPQKVSLEYMIRHQLYVPYGEAKHSGYAEMPDYEAYKKIKLQAFDAQNARDRKFLVRQLES